MSLWHFRNVKNRYFNFFNIFSSPVYNLDALLATRVGSRIARIALYCLAFFFLIVLYTFNWERIDKFPDQCNKYPNKLIQALTESQHSFEQIKANLKYLNISQSGTFIAPYKKFFSDEDKLAIVVPYRDREKNLRIFIEYMHQFLTMQNLTYQIFLVEPVRNLVFNRGLLLNVGYLEALKEMNFDCFVFHDVDMLPESLNNRYVCNKLWPTQMAISISIYKYMEAAPNYFRNLYTGGVTSYSRDIYRTINGYSNLFYGWGGEDDDVRLRVKKYFTNMTRLEPDVGRYFANCHEEDKAKNPDRFKLLENSWEKMRLDGLNSISYTIIQTEKTNMFTKFLVSY